MLVLNVSIVFNISDLKMNVSYIHEQTGSGGLIRSHYGHTRRTFLVSVEQEMP
jgi:hypothetical protein